MADNVKEKSRYIKKTEKEKVDKSSNFRCAWCGVNLMERHHIKLYSAGGQNVSENLILLCSNCHTLVHQGKISTKELLERRKKLSGEVDRNSGFLSLNKEYAIKIGGSTYTNIPNIIVHNEESILKMRMQHNNLFISLRIYDEQKNLICWMEDNKWWVENEEIFDFTCSKRLFKVQSKEKNIEICFEIDEDLINISGSLYIGGYLLKFDKEDLRLSKPSYSQRGISYKGCNFADSEVGIRICD